jgi:hypothetical protein
VILLLATSLSFAVLPLISTTLCAYEDCVIEPVPDHLQRSSPFIYLPDQLVSLFDAYGVALLASRLFGMKGFAPLKVRKLLPECFKLSEDIFGLAW